MRARTAGVLVHPTSLPGPPGIGDLGPATVRFLDWAGDAGLALWQVLPLGPTGPDRSPYAALSAYAGNPLLISPRGLIDRGWLPADALDEPPRLPEVEVDFERVAAWKEPLLRASWAYFRRRAGDEDRRAFEAFVDATSWLGDWVLFAALKRRQPSLPWTAWDADLRDRSPRALRRAEAESAEEIGYQRYLQFLFSTQWNKLRGEARSRGIEILGDIPFYPAHDSADVWVHREWFRLDERGHPLEVAGVPPDYFSDTGQLWGNPLYRWEPIRDSGFAWWVSRLRATLARVDRVRLDHFRAFAAYWEVDADDDTALEGRWARGPGLALFETLRSELGDIPLVAEDLGQIDQDVVALREQAGLPGMRVLQFAFLDAESEHRPERHSTDCVVYTATHDNDTTRGWFDSLADAQRRRVRDALEADATDVVWRMIETAYDSVADVAVVPLQDLLGLGSDARMNHPGAGRGNWRWRADAAALTDELAARMKRLAARTGRQRGEQT